MILRVVTVEARGDQRLWLAFNDGVRGEANLESILHGSIFEALHEPGYFAQATLDPICGTVVWPNGADIAPEALYELIARRTLGPVVDASELPSSSTGNFASTALG